ncbi:hypothetical protein [Solicola gregarius]|uniref:Secreted protein n=1 Tax=Solicola gregarius TaxID=2908642 RepID=A0AA46TM90_9ACTN|nr:hypothetical protein [Solicola gregarius]UYM07655.1 hypothetical protein L0C25_11465 [Solicola gregarius]
MKRINPTVAVPLAGILAVTLAIAGTTWTSASEDDERNGESGRTHDDGDMISQTVSPDEREDAAKYWTPERMRNAKPG